jgi:hypothetical protein
MSGCSSNVGNSSPSSPIAPQGSYTLTLTGTNSALNLSASTTFTLTVN